MMIRKSRVFFLLAAACCLSGNVSALLSRMASSPPGQAMRRPASQTTRFTRVAPPSLGIRLMASLTGVEAPTKQQNQQQDQHQQDAGSSSSIWQVRLYDDAVNYQEWIAVCLVTIAGTSEWRAYQTMRKAHFVGEAVIGQYPLEQAELYTHALKQEGLLVEMFPVEDD
jgi:ATP-dependent Clp protease adapter protein ClpS